MVRQAFFIYNKVDFSELTVYNNFNRLKKEIVLWKVTFLTKRNFIRADRMAAVGILPLLVSLWVQIPVTKVKNTE